MIHQRASKFIRIYDIDGNGTKELLTGHYFKGQNYLAAIYYLKQGVSTYLAQSRVASAGGSRGHKLFILMEQSFMLNGIL